MLEVTDAKLAAARSLSRTSHSRKSLVCAASISINEGRIDDMRVAVGDCVSRPMRLTHLERHQVASKDLVTKAEIEASTGRMMEFTDDIHASSEYKRYLAGVYLADLIYDLAVKGGVR